MKSNIGDEMMELFARYVELEQFNMNKIAWEEISDKTKQYLHDNHSGITKEIAEWLKRTHGLFDIYYGYKNRAMDIILKADNDQIEELIEYCKNNHYAVLTVLDLLKGREKMKKPLKQWIEKLQHTQKQIEFLKCGLDEEKMDNQYYQSWIIEMFGGVERIETHWGDVYTLKKEFVQLVDGLAVAHKLMKAK